MIARRRVLVAMVAAFCAGLALATPELPAAHAQDGGERKKKKDEEQPREKTAEEKELEKIGAEFKAKDVDALMARVPEKVGDDKPGRLKLHLGEKDDTYEKTQARGVLEDWFAARTITEVKLKSTKDLVGTFTLKFRPRKKEGERERTLLIRIARDGDAFVLKEIEVQTQ